MKNEDRILEFIGRSLQRIDQHNEQFNRMHKDVQSQQEELKKQRELMEKQ